MADTEINGPEMAVLADRLAGAAANGCDARDWIVNAWGMEWSAPEPLKAAFVQFCSTWVTGTNASAQYTQFAADYTQALANAFCAADQQLARGYSALHDRSTLPQHYDDPQPQSPYTI